MEALLKNLRTSLALLAVLALAVAATAFAHGTSSHTGMNMPMQTKTAAMSAGDLRVTLDNLLGEHALLAIWATQAGYSGAKSFPALAAQLDKNSVAISKAIGSVYGAGAAKQFLDGKNLWRAHIGYFVDYTKALAAKDAAGQKRAVAHL